MSSLKDIMEADDVEPLEAQAHRHARAAALNRNSCNVEHNLPERQPSQADVAEQHPVKRQKSDRVPRRPVSSTGPKLRSARRQGRTGPALMEGCNYEETLPRQGSSSHQDSLPSRVSDVADPHVKLTPVTGRVSVAKKGRPVHTCGICKRVFTRAEHLRRHQLSHEEPGYPCTVMDCQRSFHRPDLLARHMLRHEPDEKAVNAGETRSRSYSGSSQTQPPPLRAENPSFLEGDRGPTSSHTVASATYSSNQASSDQSGHAGSAPSHDPSNGQDTFLGADLGLGATFQAPSTNLHHDEDTVNVHQALSESLYANPTGDFHSAHSNASDSGLNVLEGAVPALSQTNSPFYTSEGTLSSAESEVSRFGSAYPSERSPSNGANTDWDAQAGTWSAGQTARANLGSPGMDVLAGNYESDSYASPQYDPPPTVSFPSGGVLSPVLAHQMVPLNRPTFSSAQKSSVQSSSSIVQHLNIHQSHETHGHHASLLGDMKHLLSPISEARPLPSITQKKDYFYYYFSYFEPTFPIAHPALASRMHATLGDAMAALGAQFGSRPEDRRASIQLHRLCRRMTVQLTDMNIQTMHAILLTEIFAQFRSQRVDVALSKQFQLCYAKLLNDSLVDSESLFAHLCGPLVEAEVEHRFERQNTALGMTEDRQQIIEALWWEWLEYETRQRLRSACFILDMHRQRFFEQRPCQPSVNCENSHLVLPCAQEVWDAPNAMAWYDAVLHSNGSSMNLSAAEKLSPIDISQQSRASQLLILFSLISQLPSSGLCVIQGPITAKILSVFPDGVISHACMALHHTPLHRLLALTGSAYVFGRRVTSHREIDDFEPHIRKWSSSPAAAQATWHACHVLHISLSASSQADRSTCICEYWALYTSALICWAFGHRSSKLRRQSSQTSTTMSMQSARKGSRELQHSSRGSSCTLEASDGGTVGRDEMWHVLAWLRMMMDMGPQEMARSGIRGETDPLLRVVKAWLDSESLEGKAMCAMMLDSCGVLGKLIDGDVTF
ncbi:MAG: hypothetical protein M1818_005895 [Claussenomyces sp. TS43310]|nr:MAG: hypothetical protein M1818_005895 [Claussenomyces sp. TS43310]